MSRKLTLVSLKNLEFAVVDYRKVTQYDPITKIPKEVDVPKHTPIAFKEPSIRKLTGSRNGQQFTEKLRTYLITEDMINKVRVYGDQEGGDRKMEFYEGVTKIFESEYVKNKFINKTLYIQIMIDSEEDKEVLQKLLELGLVDMDWVCNTKQFVEKKEGDAGIKAKSYLLGSPASPTAASSSNDSVQTELQNSPMNLQMQNLQAREEQKIPDQEENNQNQSNEQENLPNGNTETSEEDKPKTGLFGGTGFMGIGHGGAN